MAMMCSQGRNIQESPEEFHGDSSSREHRADALDLPYSRYSTIQAVYMLFPTPLRLLKFLISPNQTHVLDSKHLLLCYIRTKLTGQQAHS